MRRFYIHARFRAVIMFVAAWSLCTNLVTIFSLGFIVNSTAPERWFLRWVWEGDNYPGERE